MATWSRASLAGAEQAIEQFGVDLRFARTREGLSQMSLEGSSGVDQSLISKLERAKEPHTSLERLIRLHIALGDSLPLGHCPHDHDCAFRHPALVSNRRHVPRWW
jgi:transcriptional regulator with XRE-family HTH domain